MAHVAAPPASVQVCIVRRMLTSAQYEGAFDALTCLDALPSQSVAEVKTSSVLVVSQCQRTQPPAAAPRPMTMAERLAAAAARVPEEDVPISGTKAKPSGGKKGKKGKKGEDGAAGSAAAPPPLATVRGTGILVSRYLAVQDRTQLEAHRSMPQILWLVACLPSNNC